MDNRSLMGRWLYSLKRRNRKKTRRCLFVVFIENGNVRVVHENGATEASPKISPIFFFFFFFAHPQSFPTTFSNSATNWPPAFSHSVGVSATPSLFYPKRDLFNKKNQKKRKQKKTNSPECFLPFASSFLTTVGRFP